MFYGCQLFASLVIIIINHSQQSAQQFQTDTYWTVKRAACHFRDGYTTLQPWSLVNSVIVFVTIIITRYTWSTDGGQSAFPMQSHRLILRSLTPYEANISLLGSVHTEYGVAATRDESDQYTTFSYLEQPWLRTCFFSANWGKEKGSAPGQLLSIQEATSSNDHGKGPYPERPQAILWSNCDSIRSERLTMQAPENQIGSDHPVLSSHAVWLSISSVVEGCRVSTDPRHR